MHIDGAGAVGKADGGRIGDGVVGKDFGDAGFAVPEQVIGYTRVVGKGAVTYVALGHCHNPAIRAARAPDPADITPPVFHGAWERDAFLTLLKNAIAYTPAA